MNRKLPLTRQEQRRHAAHVAAAFLLCIVVGICVGLVGLNAGASLRVALAGGGAMCLVSLLLVGAYAMTFGGEQ